MCNSELQQLITDDSKHRQALEDWLTASKTLMADPLALLCSTTDSFTELANSLSNCGPMRLYKYQPFSERNVRDFHSSSLHLSPIDKLNDKFEGHLHFDEEFSKHALEGILQMDKCLLAPYVKQLMSAVGREANDQSLGEFMTFLDDVQRLSGSMDQLNATMLSREHILEWIREMRKGQRCGALSRTPLSPSMWDRYARRHEGFVTGYSVSEFSFPCSCARGSDASCQKGLRALLCPVAYANDIPSLGPLHVASIALTLLGVKVEEAVVLFDVLSLCRKSQFWSNEMEWRLITSAGPCNDRNVYAHMRPDSVYLGVSIGKDERLRVIEAATDMGIEKIFDMRIPDNATEYLLEAVPVDLDGIKSGPVWEGVC